MPQLFGSSTVTSFTPALADSAGLFGDIGSLASTACTCGSCSRMWDELSQPLRAGDGSGGLPAGKPVYALNQATAALLRSNMGWTPGSTVTYSFRENLPAGAESTVRFQAFSAIEREMTRYAFDLFADLVNLRFAEALDDGVATAQARRIYLGADTALPSHEWGHAQNWSFATSPVRALASSEVWISTTAVAQRQWFTGGYNFQALMHEIGHSLGLSHPGVYNAEADQTLTYAANAAYAQDSRQFSIMSYFPAAETGADFLADFRGGLYSGATPLLHDVAALQQRYGANTSTRAGDTVYGYNSTAGRPSYDFVLNPSPIFTIWDGGGLDTLDFSQTSYTVTLNLNAGAFSDAFQMTNNISIAFGVVVENAKGGSAADYMLGNAAGNLLEGLDGDDSLWGADGADRLVGGNGADTLVGQAGDDQLWGGAGADKIFGWGGADIMVGESGDDELWGGDDGDAIYGWSGADNMVGEGGDDQLWGGDDGDRAYGWSGDDLLVGEAGDDHLWGGEGQDRAYGGDGADVLVGEAGDDGLWGGEGHDTLWGRVGRDTLVGEAGNDRLWGEADNDIVHGGSGEDVLVGGSGDDELWGGDDRDALYGASGNDLLVGQAGDDELWGGDDRDVLFGWSGTDILVGEAGNDELWGGEDRDFLYGWSGSDVLVGEGGNDELWGGDDRDTLYGWSGDDLLVGESGDDELWGGEGRDVLHGSIGSDLLVGETGDDDLRGDEGADRLIGGGGADRMQGGSGADTFVFQEIGHSGPLAADRILDFGAGDVIDLAAIDADAGLAGDQAFALVSAFSNRAGQAVLSFDSASNTSALNLDLDGDGRSDFTLLFDGQVTTQGWLF